MKLLFIVIIVAVCLSCSEKPKETNFAKQAECLGDDGKFVSCAPRAPVWQELLRYKNLRDGKVVWCRLEIDAARNDVVLRQWCSA